MATAHLVAIIHCDETTKGVPTVVGVDIWSSSWRGSGLIHRPGLSYADIADGYGENYEQARGAVLEFVRSYPGLAWAKAMLEAKG